MRQLLPRTPVILFCALAILAGCKKETALPELIQPQPSQPRLYVVLGSSTAAGTGPSVYDSAWVGRSFRYLKTQKSTLHDTIVNLAVNGYSSYSILPSGDANHNITKALSFHPYAILINMPTNDIANNGTVEAQMNNFATVTDLAKDQGVQVWVTSSQPRNLSADARQKLMELNQKVKAVYGTHAIDFWSTLANADGTVKAEYNSGDGTHLNNAGHRILFSRVKASNVLAH